MLPLLSERSLQQDQKSDFDVDVRYRFGSDTDFGQEIAITSHRIAQGLSEMIFQSTCLGKP